MKNYFEDLLVCPDYDNSNVVAKFTVPPLCQSCSWQIVDGTNAIAKGESKLKPQSKFTITETIKNFKSWNINTPHLYKFVLNLNVGKECASHKVKFGMRKFGISERDVYLNNEKLFVRGVIRGREAHDHPNLMNLPLYDFYAKYMKMMKRYGFNFIRFHSEIPPMECFQAADDLGILIHVEMRKYFGKYQKERSTMAEEGKLLNRDEWIAMVKKLRNCTSLMIYCMGNEIDHPGRNPICEEFYNITKKLDPTRFFLDTCSRGEFDRKSVDLDVQHMSYFYPLGHSYNMFDNTQNWIIAGSAKNLPMIEKDKVDDCNWKIMRKMPSPRPVLAHEICHYSGLRDLDELQKKFNQHNPAKTPWWLAELKKLVKAKGYTRQYDIMREASVKFQFLSWRLGLEAARRSKVISGFHFLQFCDTDRYENSNGVVDCFDDYKGVDEKAFLKFNGDSVILVDMPRRTFFENEKINIPVIVSHFSFEMTGLVDFKFTLSNDKGEALLSGGLSAIDLNVRGRLDICELALKMPVCAEAKSLTLKLELVNTNNKTLIDNSWDLWVYPDRPAALTPLEAKITLDDVFPSARYPQIKNNSKARLMIANRLTRELIEHVDNGGDAWVMYRVPVTRDRKVRAAKEKYYLPAVWDRFKGVIWDRGHNNGAFIRSSAALGEFPNDGFLNLQFQNLINDCDKIILDDFPVKIEPIIEGVDRAVRDRFDVYNFKLSELQPAYTMRKFGYLFELTVGKGRLFVSSFNFTGLNQGAPEVAGMFESIIKYLTSKNFAPKAKITADALSKYLLAKGKGPIVKERRMTQYWQLDEEPLESKKYWEEALKYIGEEVKETDIWMKHVTEKLTVKK
ncbi:MAG: glycoside hydrolase family 2 TIM barrel-domain containing protein [Lentisphaerota bacterium]